MAQVVELASSGQELYSGSRFLDTVSDVEFDTGSGIEIDTVSSVEFDTVSVIVFDTEEHSRM